MSPVILTVGDTRIVACVEFVVLRLCEQNRRWTLQEAFTHRTLPNLELDRASYTELHSLTPTNRAKHPCAHTCHAGRVQGFRRFNFAGPQMRCENPPPPRHVARGVSPSGRHSAELRRQKTIKASRGTHDGCGKEEENGRTTMDDMHGAPAGRCCRQPPRQESQQPSLQVQPAKTTRERNIRAAAQQ